MELISASKIFANKDSDSKEIIFHNGQPRSFPYVLTQIVVAWQIRGESPSIDRGPRERKSGLLVLMKNYVASTTVQHNHPVWWWITSTNRT